MRPGLGDLRTQHGAPRHEEHLRHGRTASFLCCICNVYDDFESNLGPAGLKEPCSHGYSPRESTISRPTWGTAMNLILTKMREEGKDVINLGLGDPDVVPAHRGDAARPWPRPVSTRPNHHYPSFYSPGCPLKRPWPTGTSGNYNADLRSRDRGPAPPGLGRRLVPHPHGVSWTPATWPWSPTPAIPAYIAGVHHRRRRSSSPVPLLKENGFLPNLKAIAPEVAKKAKMIWVNYPNNPTFRLRAPRVL